MPPIRPVPSGHGLILKNLNLPWRAILHLARAVRLRPGDILGEASGCGKFYFIAEGTIRMTYSADDGTQFLVALLEENCVCGEALVDISCRSARFECVTKAQVHMFDKKLLLDPDFVRAHPLQYINLLQSAGIKLTHTFASARALAVDPPLQRVCSFLLHLIHEQGAAPCPGLTHEELAAFLGMHRSTLTRTLRALRGAGAIGAFTRKRLEVFDARYIEDRAAGNACSG